MPRRKVPPPLVPGGHEPHDAATNAPCAAQCGRRWRSWRLNMACLLARIVSGTRTGPNPVLLSILVRLCDALKRYCPPWVQPSRKAVERSEKRH
eukprot:6467448-Prymnesium_polylepis.1